MNKKLITILLVILFIWNIFLSVELFKKNSQPQNNVQVIDNIVNGFSTDLTEVSKKAKTSIVTVKSGASISSGFIYSYDDNKAYIITTAHGIDIIEDIRIIFDNEMTYSASLVGIDEKSDVALVSVDINFEVSPLAKGDANYLSKAEFLLAFGSTNTNDSHSTVSLVLVNDKQRMIEKVKPSKDGITRIYQSYIEVTSTINPGKSGGPLINMNGDVVGMTVMSEINADNTILALPINEITMIADKLMEKNSYSKVEYGIKGRNVSDMENYQKVALGLNIDIIDGFYVTGVLSDSMASYIGISKGDVIIKVYDQAISNYDDLLASQYQSYENYNFTIIRNGEVINLIGVYND